MSMTVTVLGRKIRVVTLMATLYITLLVIPIFHPLGIPMAIPERVQMFYDYLETIEPGDYVLFQNGYLTGISPEVWMTDRSQFLYKVEQILRNGGRILFWGGAAFMWSVEDAQISHSPTAKKLIEEGKGYGVSWIYLAFQATDETSWKAFLDNIWIGKRDALYNRLYEEYPIMEGVHTAHDLRVALGAIHPMPVQMIRQFVDIFHKDYLFQGATYLLVECEKWIEIGKMQGALPTPQDVAAYEIAFGQPGTGCIKYDAMNLMLLSFPVLAAICNVYYFTVMRRRKIPGVVVKK